MLPCVILYLVLPFMVIGLLKALKLGESQTMFPCVTLRPLATLIIPKIPVKIPALKELTSIIWYIEENVLFQAKPSDFKSKIKKYIIIQ